MSAKMRLLEIFSKSVLNILMICIGLAACNFSSKSNRSKINDAKTLILKRDLQISARNDSLLIGGFQDVQIDYRGNIYAADPQQSKIWVFSPDGNYLRSFGKKGKGPGEFQGIGEMVMYHDTLYVMDYILRRIVLFDASKGRLISTFNIPNVKVNGKPGGLLGSFFVTKKGNLGVAIGQMENQMNGIRSMKEAAALIRENGKEVQHVLFQYPGQTFNVLRVSGKYTMMYVMPFEPISFLVMGPDNHLYEGRSDSIKIYKYGLDGGRQLYINSPQQGVELTSEESDSVLKKYKNPRVRNISLPDRWPVYSSFLIDDSNRVWIKMLNPEKQQKRLIIFDRSGKLRWKSMINGKVSIVMIVNKELYGISRDSGGATSVVRYRIEGL